MYQQDVADKIDCTKMTISRAERGEPIFRKFIEKLVRWGRGRLKAADFNQHTRPKREDHGTKSQAKERSKKARTGKVRRGSDQ